MLDGQTFYFGSIRKLTVAFADLFNNIHLKRTDENDVEIDDIKVGIAYGPKQHYISKMRQGELADPTAMNIVLPRLSFELTSIEYDVERQLSPTHNCGTLHTDTTDPSIIYKVLNPVPYNFRYSLSIYSKNTDDGLRILEQILPWFTPEFNVTVIEIPSADIKSDVPVILETVTQEDNYQEGFENNRLIVWNLEFIARGYIYKPIGATGIIKQVFNDLIHQDFGTLMAEVDVEVDPLTAEIDDPWVPKTTITEY